MAGRKKDEKESVKIANNDNIINNTEDGIKSLSKPRLIGGFSLLLLGCFLTLSILSYFTSWKIDQDNIISSKGLWDFLFKDNIVVENWCGRIGAALAHFMVYDGVGIVSIFFTLWLAGVGVNILYTKRPFPALRWVRWMALAFLFICPLLSFTIPNSSFPWGGNLGNSLIEWTNGFAGKAGNIAMLIGVLAFFVFIVFQFDIKKIISKTNQIFPSINPSSTPNDSENYEMENDEFENNSRSTGTLDPKLENAFNNETPSESNPIISKTNNRLKGETSSDDVVIVTDELSEQELVFEVTEKELPLASQSTSDDTSTNTKEVITSGAAVSVQQSTSGIVLELPQDAIEIDDADLLIDDDDEQEQLPDDDLDFEINAPAQEEEKGLVLNPERSVVGDLEPYDPELDLRDYKFPTLDLLEHRDAGEIALDREELDKNKTQIINTLRSFGIEIQRISATVGPTVTLYEIVPSEGVRISKIRNLEDDIALNLAALGIRIIAPIPGRGTIGIEVPNRNKQIVSMSSLLSSEKFINNKMSLPIALGKKIDNENYIVDLASMPHLLVAGATGQGKSVGINAILVSLLYKKHPSQLKFVMVDPKIVELSIYKQIEKHYLAKLPNEDEAIITDTKKVINTLNSLCIEMDNRYELLRDANTRNIKEYNDKFIKRKLNPNNGHKYLPFIVLVIDEFADLIMTAGKEIEAPIARLAQKARAIGIHIIVATQRPSVNVITGVIKANFPARLAFKVSSKIDSRTILDTGGADQLIGRGDMLISHGSELLRVQCAFVDTPEVERIVEFIGQQRGYPSAFELPEYEGADDDKGPKEVTDLSKLDKMFEECARLVVGSQSGSTSMLQRRFNLGYNRAGRIMDQLEAAGIVGPASGSKPRDVLMSTEYELEQHLKDILE